MGSSSEFTTMHHRDVHHYYLALQTFFDVIEVKYDRSNSPRAQKARAKLLKLSASQFYELSTDVYDELQRRINDEQTQSEYLLPKASFHMKRNQARQKLANLSQTRFNDLVDDILFEIKRRGYDVKPDTAPQSRTASKEINGYETSLNRTTATPSKYNTTSSNSDLSSTYIPPTATIQTSNIIPKKASIDWSSDEEDAAGRSISDLTPTEERKLPSDLNNAKDSPDNNDSNISLQSYPQQSLTPVLKTVSDNYHYGDLNDSPLDEGFRKLEGKSNSEHTAQGNENADIESFKNNLTADGKSSAVDELKREIAALEGSNENLTNLLGELKSENTALKGNVTRDNAGNFASNETFQKELSSLSSQVSALSIENEKLKQQLSEMELKAKRMMPLKAESTASEVNINLLDNLQTKYPLDQKSLSKYITEEGSIPFESIKHAHSFITLLFANLQQEKEDIGKDLFENLSRLSNSISQILVLVDVPEFKDEVILLRASLSHLITAIRYYSIYNSLLPKITVQAAIAELAFAICNLIGSTKIKLDDSNNGKRSSVTINSQDNKNPHTPRMDPLNNNPSQDLLKKPGEVAGGVGDGKDEMSPVKPLKITQRANMSPNLKPSSSRKTSGNLLFPSMINTKSPLSSSHSGRTNDEPSSGTVKEVSATKDKRPLKFETRSSQDSSSRQFQNGIASQPITPTKSVTNNNVKLSNGTPSLPTPTSAAREPSKKVVRENQTEVLPSSKKPVESPIRKQLISGENEEEATNGSSKSFTDKLKTFANSAGIGLRVDKEQLKSANASQVKNLDEKGDSHEVPLGPKVSSQESRTYNADTEQQKEITPKKSDYYGLKSSEANPTPSKLTDKLRKTFEDISDDDSDENSKSDLNNSSNFSDDGSTYMALKQSLNRGGAGSNEPRVVKKATVYSPRAEHGSIFNGGDTRSGTDNELSDFNTELSLANGDDFTERSAATTQPTTNDSLEATISKKAENPNSKLDRTENLLTVKEKTNGVAANNDPRKDTNEDLDEGSDYQFVPLRKEEGKAESKDQGRMAKDIDDNEEEDRDANFDVDAFDIENPDNTLSELLLYLEHQTVEVISTIQSLLSSIKAVHATKGNLRQESNAINQVIRQMVDATSISMNQSRNASLKEHGTWVVKSLEDCSLRMISLCQLNAHGNVNDVQGDEDFADKHFKQRLAGIAFDVAKCTKELVKTVEEASLKEDIAYLNSRLN